MPPLLAPPAVQKLVQAIRGGDGPKTMGPGTVKTNVGQHQRVITQSIDGPDGPDGDVAGGDIPA